MFKKWLIPILAVLTVLVVVVYLNRESLTIVMIKSQIGPDHDFDAALLPAAPDYSLDSGWAALPSIADPSDEMPAGVTAAVSPAPVAVFFVHPTSYIKKDNWNQPLAAHDANWIVDNRVLRHQASVFNGCCDVYAPRYRQATFYSFLDQDGNGALALGRAYEDVLAAFEEFIVRLEVGRPFILAGHSQGTRHATQLLREEIAGSALQDRLVAAYLIGFEIEKDALGGVPLCADATATGCAVGWNSVAGTGTGLYPGAKALICTNPLSWQQDGGHAAHELNEGAIGYLTYMMPAEDEDYTAMEVEVAVADAECVKGMLRVPELRSESFPSRMPGNSMHVYDYSLFYMNIRNNAAQRVTAFLSEG
jgi:hypothetical protein